MPWLKTFNSLTIFLALLLSVSACSGISHTISGNSGKRALDPEVKAEPQPTHESRFEWAIQHYESGHYEDAIASLKNFENNDALLSNFPLVPFYLGLSHFNLGHFDKAESYLNSFLQFHPKLTQAQDARIALLHCRERAEDWKSIAALAASAERFPLYAEQRIRLKLVWSHALLRLKEFGGAKKSIQETEALINNFTREPSRIAELAANNEEFHAKLFLLHLLAELEDCNAVAAPRKKGPNLQLSVDMWVEARGDCLLRAVNKGLDRGMAFGEHVRHWTTAMGNYFVSYTLSSEEIRGLYPSLVDAQLANRGKIRAGLYRITAAIERKLQDNSLSASGREPLQKLQKLLEDLLLQLSLLS